MKMFMFKSILIAALMFVSVLFGMQQANEGIHRMKGFEDTSFDGALTLSENQNGDLEVSVLGNDISSHDLQKKKEKLEEMKAYNFFSSLGKKLAKGISSLSEKVVQMLGGFLNF